VTHHEYFIASWSGELELWESRAFRKLSSPDEASAADVRGLQQTLGRLGEFLTSARYANRNLLRRTDVSDLIVTQVELAAEMRTVAQRVDRRLDDQRNTLRQGMALLGSLSSSVQIAIGRRQRELNERLQQSITVVTAAFLVPTIVIGIYGANLKEIAGDATGDLFNLTAWIISTLGISWSALGFFQRRPAIGRTSWQSIGLLVLMAVALAFCVALSSRHLVTLIVGVVSWTTTATLAALAYRRYRARLDVSHHDALHPE
jgi:Mg2+ and Co2+ transporter CorA